jgi:integrase
LAEKTQYKEHWETSDYGKIKVYVRRHVGECTLKDVNATHCNCPKYFSAVPKDRALRPTPPQFSAGTTSFPEAVTNAKKLLRSWDPVAQENAQLKEQRERTETTIEAAVKEFLAARRDTLGDTSTVGQYSKILLSSKSDITLLNWLKAHHSSVTLLSQVTPSLLRTWRQSWKLKSSSKKIYWDIVSMFFGFCFDSGYFHGAPNPARALDTPLVGDDVEGTGVFSDEQWFAFLAAVDTYAPSSVDTADLPAFRQRQRTYWELMRWSGMAIVDNTQFHTSLVSKDGMLLYHRWKLRRKKKIGWATLRLPQHVLDLLKVVPLAPGFSDPKRPFLSNVCTRTSCEDQWRVHFNRLCDIAGIKEIEGRKFGSTITMVKPRVHALRDTFAVFMLTKSRNIKFVSDCLGHTNSKITEDLYLPWCKSLNEMHRSICDEVMPHVGHLVYKPREVAKVVSIGG